MENILKTTTGKETQDFDVLRTIVFKFPTVTITLSRLEPQCPCSFVYMIPELCTDMFKNRHENFLFQSINL